MFTGIVETLGTVTAVEPRGGSTALEIEAPEIAASAGIGDSVAVNGGCLTVTHRSGNRLRFEAVRETLVRTSLGRLDVGARVNLERALRAGDRMDGHMVQGHVDGTGRVARLERDGDDVRLFIDCDTEIADLLVEKGSVAIDGVSLTVVGVRDDGFDVALIPHTLTLTTLGERVPGDPVNLEVDILGKYVKKFLERMSRASGSRES
jgi:riboflavin synthase